MNEPQKSTNILKMDAQGLARAAAALQRGELVAFPTETVYGLGADATNDAAVASIFEAKGRPSFNPLIVHVPDIEAAWEHVQMTDMAYTLAETFWPGPLTMVLRRRPDCRLSLLVSAGLDTVAIRLPDHDDARQLMRLAKCPLAAPSANASGRLSPTSARHVHQTLAGRIHMILDGGDCPVGVESTVIDLSTGAPVLLRPGGLPVEDIEAVLGGTPLPRAMADETAPKSPGMMLSHYAPRLPVRLNADGPGIGEAYLAFGPGNDYPSLSQSGDLVEAAANLFRLLHRLDDPDRYSGIAVAPVPHEGLGLAINDRLERAAKDS